MRAPRSQVTRGVRRGEQHQERTPIVCRGITQYVLELAYFHHMVALPEKEKIRCAIIRSTRMIYQELISTHGMHMIVESKTCRQEPTSKGAYLQMYETQESS